MIEPEVLAIDPHDEVALHQWWEVGANASAGRPYDAWPAWEVSRRALPLPNPTAEVTLLLARRRGEVVGSGLIVLRTKDNLHQAEIEVYVAPDRRRTGVGQAVLKEAERWVREAGRGVVISTVFAPVESESPGFLFARTHGYTLASAEETKLVDLAMAEPTWDVLWDESETVAARAGYTHLVFEDRCPEGYVDGVCRVLSVFLEEIPTGDLDLTPIHWTPERLRAGEQRAADMGRTSIIALSISPEGEVCGFSDLRVHPDDPGPASVGGTLVLPGHRGHRLGLGMKLLTHRRLRELFPHVAHVETGNAGVNAPMNLVNERMGYRVVERALDVQKVLDLEDA